MLVCRGELISNCRSLDGSSQQQCFVQGLNVVQDCADTRNYPTQLAPAMLAAGQGIDGQEGSLCTAVSSPTDPTLNKCAPLWTLSALHARLWHKQSGPQDVVGLRPLQRPCSVCSSLQQGRWWVLCSTGSILCSRCLLCNAELGV